MGMVRIYIFVVLIFVNFFLGIISQVVAAPLDSTLFISGDFKNNLYVTQDYYDYIIKLSAIGLTWSNFAGNGLSTANNIQATSAVSGKLQCFIDDQC